MLLFRNRIYLVFICLIVWLFIVVKLNFLLVFFIGKINILFFLEYKYFKFVKYFKVLGLLFLLLIIKI